MVLLCVMHGAVPFEGAVSIMVVPQVATSILLAGFFSFMWLQTMRTFVRTIVGFELLTAWYDPPC